MKTTAAAESIMDDSDNHLLSAVLALGLLFLIFFQLLTDFIAGIYAYGLLDTGIPTEMAAVALFFSPFLLLLVRRVPVSGLFILAELVVLCRAVAVLLPTRGQLLVSGLGVSLFLLFFPAWLWEQGRRRAGRQGAEMGPALTAGLTLAVALSLLLRTLGGTMDFSNEGGWRVIAWLLAGAAAVLLPGLLFRRPASGFGSPRPFQAGWRRTAGRCLGLAAVLVLLYFGFTTPAVISHWTRANYLLVTAVMVLALALFAWRLPGIGGSRPGRVPTLVLTAAFVLALTLTLALNQDRLPGHAAAYPLAETDAGSLGDLPTLATLLLFPVLPLLFGSLVDSILRDRPSLPRLGLGFGLAAVFMLLMILAHVFTTVWAYIDPALEPLFRGRFWQLHFLVGLTLLLSFYPVHYPLRPSAANGGRRAHRLFLGLVAGFGVVTVAAAFLASPTPSAPRTTRNLSVAGYNVHQGYDASGQRGHLAQCEVLREIDADVIGLSETDTARVAGGNFDIVRYLAACLDMHAYEGPRAGAGTFGYALLSKYPLENAQTTYLFSGPGLPSADDPEESSEGDQVAVIRAEVTAGETTYTIFVNHFDSNPPLEQPEEFAVLAEGLRHVIAIGDYNCQPGGRCLATIEQVLNHCAGSGGDAGPAAGRIDHILVSPDLECPAYGYLESDASDHPAVYAGITPQS